MSSPALKTVSINGENMHLLINSTQRPNEKKFNTLPDEIVNLGDIVLWQEMHWLVTQVDFDDEISRSGNMVQCNRQIRWQNSNTYEIVERWCLLTKPYTSNINEGFAVSTSNREFKIQLPFDDETRLIDLDKRFMLEIINGRPRTYKCTSVDQNTNKYQDIDGGLIVINLSQDEAGQTDDRADLMICNYKKPPETLEPSPTLLRCSISGRDNIRIGFARRYTATFYGEDGETVDDEIIPVWSIVVPSGDESKVIWSQNESFIEITVTDDSMIGKTVVIGLADSEGLYSPVELRAEVVDLYV